jgi:PAS domain S-box-containing protein
MDHLTNKEFNEQLGEMRQRMQEIETCRREFLNVQQRYEKLLESAPDAMVFVNLEGKIVFVNAQLERLFGYSQEELAGKDLEILIPERYHAQHRRHVSDYFASPRVRPMGTGLRIYGLSKDGTEFPADISLSPLATDGSVLTVGAIRDITERVRAEERIERGYHIQRVISSVLKIALEPISLEEQLDRVLDLIHTIPHLALESRGYIYLTEDSSDTLVLRAPRALPESPRPVCERISFGHCLCGKAAASCEIEFVDCLDDRHEVRYQDDFPHGHYCVPIVSGGKALGVINLFVQAGHKNTAEEEAFLTAIADTLAGVIERGRTNEERQRLTAELAEAEKLSALGRITLNVADEFRNPITAVGGFARRLQKKLPDASKEREYAESIVTEVSRLEVILRHVLALTRPETPRLTEQDIRAAIGEALGQYDERSREQGVTISKTFSDLPPVVVDRAQMVEALGHLISNAFDAMPEGGILTVSTGRETVQGMPYAVVKISDTGEGISEERLGMVFEPFFSTRHGASKGTGFGLPIAKKIIEEHRGFIRSESIPGKGATFSIYLPFSSPEDLS